MINIQVHNIFNFIARKRASSFLCIFYPRDTPPAFPVQNIVNIYRRYIKHVCKFFNCIRVFFSTNKKNIIVRKGCIFTKLPTWSPLSIFAITIPHIISICSKKEMRWINANWVVTLVANVKRKIEFPVFKKIRKATCPPCLSFIAGNPVLPTSTFQPMPAFVSAPNINIVPECCFHIFFMGHNVVRVYAPIVLAGVIKSMFVSLTKCENIRILMSRHWRSHIVKHPNARFSVFRSKPLPAFVVTSNINLLPEKVVDGDVFRSFSNPFLFHSISSIIKYRFKSMVQYNHRMVQNDF